MELLLEAANLRHDDKREELKSSSTTFSEVMSDDDWKVEGEVEERGQEDKPDQLSNEGASTSDMKGCRKRKRLSLEEDQMSDDSKKQSSDQHNENERKRRKSMKSSVCTLRDQLTRKTRRPAVNTVLKAAYEEIQELKSDEKEKEAVLEELRKKNIVLKYLLEKAINELKQQSPKGACSNITSPTLSTLEKPDRAADVTAIHSPPPPPPAKSNWVWESSPVSTTVHPPLATAPGMIPSPTPYISPSQIPSQIPVPSQIPSQISSPQSATFFAYPTTFTGHSPSLSFQGVNLSPPGMCSPPSFYHPAIPFVPMPAIPRTPLTIPSVYYPSSPTVLLPSAAATSYSNLRSSIIHVPPTAIQGTYPLLDNDCEKDTRTYSKKNKSKRTKEPRLELERIKVSKQNDSTVEETNSMAARHSSQVEEQVKGYAVPRTSVITDYRKGVS